MSFSQIMSECKIYFIDRIYIEQRIEVINYLPPLFCADIEKMNE